MDAIVLPSLAYPITPFLGWHLGSIEEVATEEMQGPLPMRVAAKNPSRLSMVFHQFPRSARSLAYLAIPDVAYLEDQTPVTYAGSTWRWGPVRQPLRRPSDQRSVPHHVRSLWDGRVGIAPLGQVLQEFAQQTQGTDRVLVVDHGDRKMRGYLRSRPREFGFIKGVKERGPAWYLFSTNPLEPALQLQLTPTMLRDAFRNMARVPRNCNSLAYLTLDDQLTDPKTFEPSQMATLTYGVVTRDEDADIHDWSLSWSDEVRGPAGDLLAWYEQSMMPPRGLVVDAPFWTTRRYLKQSFDVATVDSFRLDRDQIRQLEERAVQVLSAALRSA